MTSRLGRRGLLLGAGAVGGALLVDAVALEPRWLDVSRHRVPVRGLPASLRGLTLAQVTDAHLERLGWLQDAIVAAVQRENAQLVVLTGDIVEHPSKLGVLTDFCRALVATGASVFGTPGNWEHWGGVSLDALGAAYQRAGARLLVNENLVTGGVTLAATDDGLVGAARFARALSGVGGSGSDVALRLLLTHSPAVLDSVAASRAPPRFALTLAGHTHGGQVRLGSLAPLLPPGSGRFVMGWYQTAFGATYVSRGTGTSVAPVRFSCRPELPVFRFDAE